MSERQEIERLKRRISHLAPATTVMNLIIGSVGTLVAELVRQLRQMATAQPLTTLVFALQAGFLVARVGRRHAQH